MKITILGIPIAKARARTVRQGRSVVTYDPQSNLKFSIKQQMKLQLSGISGQLNPLIVYLNFYFPYPATKNPWILPYHTTKPDIDNCIKWILDCANQILFHDDKQIVEIYAKKLYSDQPRTEIEIMPINDLKLDENVLKVLKIFDPATLKEFVNHASTLARIFQEVNPDYPRHDSQKWLTAAASLLMTIAKQYTPKLTKLKKLGEIPLDTSLLHSPVGGYTEIY